MITSESLYLPVVVLSTSYIVFITAQSMTLSHTELSIQWTRKLMPQFKIEVVLSVLWGKHAKMRITV